jgi:cell division protein ZapA (FtsZ GTPase activity inhibitor)
MQVSVLNQEFAIPCEANEEHRLEDLARALETRLQGCREPNLTRRLMLTALSLMDEVQAAHCALARSRCEIERLTDLVVDARMEAERAGADGADRGRVGALRRVAEGAA